MTAYDERLNIDTPENVTFGYEVAGIGSRFLATVFDTLLIIFLQMLVYTTLLLILTSVNTISTLFASASEAWLFGLLGLLAFAFFWGYYVFFEILWNGQSPGKRLIRLRVIRQDGTPAGVSEAIIRNLIRLIDFLPATYGVGVITMFIDRQSRRLGDLAAGTLVVYDQGEVTLDSLQAAPRPEPTLSAPAGSESLLTGLPLEKLTPQDYRLAREYLRRGASMTNRDDLLRQVSQALLTRLGTPTTNLTLDQRQDLIQAIVAYQDQPLPTRPDTTASSPPRPDTPRPDAPDNSYLPPDEPSPPAASR